MVSLMKYAKPLMLLCLLLAVLLSLPACTGGGEIPLESETDAETVPDSGAAAPPTVLELVKDGRSDYRIVYADDASEAIRSWRGPYSRPYATVPARPFCSRQRRIPSAAATQRKF